MYYTSRAKAKALHRATDKFLYYDKLCYKLFIIHLDAFAEGVELLQPNSKYERVVNRATAKRDQWKTEVERILYSR